MEIPKGRCCCCGLKATGTIEGNELCNLHYRLTMKDIKIALKFFKHAEQYRVAENLGKGDWQYEPPGAFKDENDG